MVREVKLSILKRLLQESINSINAGNNNYNENELDDIIKELTKLNRGIKRISKHEACERILHCSPSTFDNFDEMYAKHQVDSMYHTKRNGGVCRGEVYSIEDAKRIYEKYVRNIDSSYTCWDVYVAINAQFHDYARLYSEWHNNISREDLDEKIIASAVNFWFKDEDAGVGKVWNYFKNIGLGVYINDVAAVRCDIR